LSPIKRIDSGVWAHEPEAAFSTSLGKIGVLASESRNQGWIARRRSLSRRNDRRHIEIADDGAGPIQTASSAILMYLARGRFRSASSRPSTPSSRCALDAQGDLAAVGDQYFFKHASKYLVWPMGPAHPACLAIKAASLITNHEQGWPA
jgi:hypothetical protein